MINQKGGTKCSACETEQPGNERILDVSVGAGGSEVLAYSRIGADRSSSLWTDEAVP